jgi:hypothetical protein
MLVLEVMTLCHENHMEHVNTLSRQNMEICLFLVSSTNVSVTPAYDNGLKVNNDSERIWKKASVS